MVRTTLATVVLGGVAAGALALGGVALSVSAEAAPAAKTIIVEMKDSGPEGAMVFVPSFVRAMSGDTIRFAPTSKAHNAETIPTMLPAGVAPSKGAMGKQFDLVVTTPGLYGIKCLPHYSMGMVALIQVGKGPSANLAAARAAKLPPFAAKRMMTSLAKAQ